MQDNPWHCTMCNDKHPAGMSHSQAMYHKKPQLLPKEPEHGWSPYQHGKRNV